MRFFLSFVCATAAFAQALPRVVDSEGKPVANAIVRRGLSTWDNTWDDGTFRISVAPFVLITAAGFRPELVVGPRPAASEILLTRKPAREFAACTEGRGQQILRGGMLGVQLPKKGWKVRSMSDVDYTDVSATSNANGVKATLAIMHGHVCCSGLPSKDQLMKSEILDMALWIFKRSTSKERERADSYVLDIRGRTSSGEYWRWLGPVLGEQITYSGVNAEAVRFLDSAMDGLCAYPGLPRR